MRALYLLPLLLAASLLAGEPAPANATKAPLTKGPLKEGLFRLGYGLKGEMPKDAYQGTIGGESIIFFDLDGNGELQAETDGMALLATNFIVPIPKALLLKTGQYKLAFDGVKIALATQEDLGVFQKYVAEASVLTEMRIRAGVSPAALDTAACAACEKHCDYMKLNGLAGGAGGMSAHKEDPNKPGYTEEGAKAGAQGNIFPAAPGLRVCLLGWYATAWHGEPMVVPGLLKVGVGFKSGVAVLHFAEETHGDEIFVHPADGATGIPLRFGSHGEMPNPVAGTSYGRGCGFPIIAQLNRKYQELLSAEVLDPAGKPVAGTISSPAKPANKDWPENSGCAVFIPSKPLASNTLYKVTFKLAGAEKPLTWSFTTGR